MPHVPAAERRPQLIEAAIALMSREGVAAGSTRAVAAELGVAQATVHYTFGSKQELYRAVMEELTRSLVTLVEAAVPDDTGFEETVHALVGALWDTVTAYRDRYLLVYELITHALRDPRLRETAADYATSLDEPASRLISDAAARAGLTLAHPPATLARLFLAGFDGLVLRYLADGDESVAVETLRRLQQTTIALAKGSA
ncbi:TetR/AcrR family transcriptional regulator [Rhizohabitans arisaemae]|uniref:TetR/AcrR family transcriptional regulator n=1 Tax=Rhizohabitans arisaemae TaxID=2720610 RepID=UPI0024B0CA68|nr:TetR family transcriptional regulator [Rhizohabitans arisaemae]